MSLHAESTLPLILVLLPVYNGEKFLSEQIDSILAQTHQNLRLICRDDGSSDASLKILQSCAASHPDKVQLLQDNKGNLGAAGSFSELMQWALVHSGVDSNVYVALADQDDTWHVEKLERCLRAMIKAEYSSPGKPVLVHSDLKVVNAVGGKIAPSFMRYQGLDPTRTQLSAQLVSNTVTGCTSLMNLMLLKKALPIPNQVIMHDWWLSLVASKFGRLIFLPQALVNYRQHGRNTLGARENKIKILSLQTLRKLFQLRQTPQTQAIFDSVAAQASEFLSRYETELSDKEKLSISKVQQIPQYSIWRQRWVFNRLRSSKQL
jgi:glycosyltransferase involved in cell wall biosynthesis